MGLWANQILAMALVALYLWDCVKSVPPQRRIIQQTFRGPQLLFSAFKFGSGLRTLINPLTPFFSTSITSALGHADYEAPATSGASGPYFLIYQIMIALQLGLVAVAAPISLIYMRDQWFLVVVFLSYLNFAVIAISVWREGGRIRLSSKRRCVLLFESFVCIPYSINLLRNLSLIQECPFDLYGAFRRLPIDEQRRYAKDMRYFLEELSSSEDLSVAAFIVDAMKYVTSISDD